MSRKRVVLPPPNSLMGGLNRPVFDFLQGQSAHSDTVEVLWKAVKDLPGIEIYCADRMNFGYVVVCLNEIVFAFAVGMQGVWLRFPVERVAALAAEGAVPQPRLGAGWMFLEFWGKNRFEERLADLCREAHAACGIP